MYEINFASILYLAQNNPMTQSVYFSFPNHELNNIGIFFVYFRDSFSMHQRVEKEMTFGPASSTNYILLGIRIYIYDLLIRTVQPETVDSCVSIIPSYAL